MIALIMVAQGRGVKALRSRRKGPREQVNAELLDGGIVWFVLHEVPNPVRPGAVARLQLGDGKVPLDPVVVGIFGQRLGQNLGCPSPVAGLALGSRVFE